MLSFTSLKGIAEDPGNQRLDGILDRSLKGTCPQSRVVQYVDTDFLLSLTTARVRNQLGACEKPSGDSGLGGGFPGSSAIPLKVVNDSIQ